MRRATAEVTTRTDTQQHRLELLRRRGDRDVEPGPARRRPGGAYAEVIIDKAAMVRHLEEAWNAVLRPTLVDFRGGAWFLSTPKGLNFFKRLYDRGDPGYPDWAGLADAHGEQPLHPPTRWTTAGAPSPSAPSPRSSRPSSWRTRAPSSARSGSRHRHPQHAR